MSSICQSIILKKEKMGEPSISVLRSFNLEQPQPGPTFEANRGVKERFKKRALPGKEYLLLTGHPCCLRERGKVTRKHDNGLKNRPVRDPLFPALQRRKERSCLRVKNPFLILWRRGRKRDDRLRMRGDSFSAALITGGI